MVGAFDDAARVVAAQAFEIPLREIHFQIGVASHRIPHVRDELVIGVSHQDAGETGRQREDVVSAVPAEHAR